MGAWGNAPKDNDSSEDRYDRVLRKVMDLIYDGLRGGRMYDSHDRWEKLGYIQLIIERMPGAVSQDLLKSGQDYCWAILEDDAFFEDWKESAKVRAATRSLLKKIENLLSKM